MTARKSFSENKDHASETNHLSSDFVAIVFQDPRPINQEFKQRIRYGNPAARFGDWYAFSNKLFRGYTFLNPYLPGEHQLDVDRDTVSLVALSTERLAVVSYTCIQLWNPEFKMEKSIPFDSSMKLSDQTAIKLSSTHVIGLDRQSFPWSGYEYHIWCANVDTGKVSRVQCQFISIGDAQITALPTPDKKTQTHFAAVTSNEICVYEVVEEKNQQFKHKQDIPCKQGGKLSVSTCGQFWITNATWDSHTIIPSRLWRVDQRFQPTEWVNLDLPECWFAGHFVRRYGNKLYATDPHTLVTYDLCPDFNVDFCFQFDDVLVCKQFENGQVIFLTEKNFYESNVIADSVTSVTKFPQAVSRVALSYLGFFSKIVFSPLIPDFLPTSLHHEARVLQYELRANPDSLNQMRGILQQWPERFESVETYQEWIQQFNLQNHDARVKIFFDNLFSERLIMTNLTNRQTTA
jgi:hypothetical protein